MAERTYKAKIYLTSSSSVKDYNFAFDYINKTYIKVKIGVGTEPLKYGSDYTVVDHTVRLVNNPPDNILIEIYRETPTDRKVEWYDSSILRAKDLNLYNIIILHINEEHMDKLHDTGLLYDMSDGKWDARFRNIKNLADPVEEDEAVTLGYMQSTQNGYIQQTEKLVSEATQANKDAKHWADVAKDWSGGNFVTNPDYDNDKAQVKAELTKIKDTLEDNEKSLSVIFPMYGDSEVPPSWNTDGDCIVCGINNKWFMVDTYHQERNFRKIQQTFARKGITELEFIVITHYHEDHFINLELFLKNYKVKKVILPPLVESQAASVNNRPRCIQWCNTYHVPYEDAHPTTFDFNGVTITLSNISKDDIDYYDNATDYVDYNDYSIVTTLEYKGKRILLTGDLGREGHRRCQEKGYFRGTYDIYKLGHHDNASTNLQAYREIHPRYVVATQTPGMSRLSYIHGGIAYFTHRGIATYIVGYQQEDLEFIVNIYDVRPISRTTIAGAKGSEAYAEIYVDKSIPDGSFCNGSPNYPFYNFNDALLYAYELSLNVSIRLSDGDYSNDLPANGQDSLVIRDMATSFSFVGNNSNPENVIIPPIVISGCKYIYATGFTIKAPKKDAILIITSKASFNHIKITGGRRSFGIRCSSMSNVSITDTQIDNTYLALGAEQHSTLVIQGNDNIVTNSSYSFWMERGGEIYIAGNGVGDNLAYPYIDTKPLATCSTVHFSEYQTRPTDLRLPVGRSVQKTNGRAPLYIKEYVATSLPKDTGASTFRDSYYNIIENSISEKPLYIGQVAVVSGVAYIATGTSGTSDWKRITN